VRRQAMVSRAAIVRREECIDEGSWGWWFVGFGS